MRRRAGIGSSRGGRFRNDNGHARLHAIPADMVAWRDDFHQSTLSGLMVQAVDEVETGRDGLTAGINHVESAADGFGFQSWIYANKVGIIAVGELRPGKTVASLREAFTDVEVMFNRLRHLAETQPV